MHSPPMCMAVPSDDGGPPLVLDMNANQFGRSDTAEAAIAAGYGREPKSAIIKIYEKALGTEFSDQ